MSAKFEPTPKKQQSVIASQSATFFRGPLPPPEVLKEYDLALAGAAERVIAMSEHQAKHRHDLERFSVRFDAWLRLLTVVLAFLIACLSVGGGFYLVLHGQSLSGMTAFLSALGAIVVAFLKSSKNRPKD